MMIVELTIPECSLLMDILDTHTTPNNDEDAELLQKLTAKVYDARHKRDKARYVQAIKARIGM